MNRTLRVFVLVFSTLGLIVIGSPAQSQTGRWHYAYYSLQNGFDRMELNLIDPDQPQANLSNIALPIDSELRVTTYASLSPNGEYLALLLGEKDEAPGNERLIRIFNINSRAFANVGKGRLVINSDAFWGTSTKMDWSPNGNYLALTLGDGGFNAALWLYDTQKRNLFRLSSTGQDNLYGAVWSNDSRFVVTSGVKCSNYLQWDTCNVSLIVFDVLSQSQVANLSAPYGMGIADEAICPLAWSPDNKYIAYSLACILPFNTSDLYLWEFGLGKTIQITNYGENCQHIEPACRSKFTLKWLNDDHVMIGVQQALPETSQKDNLAALRRTVVYNVSDQHSSFISASGFEDIVVNPVNHRIAYRILPPTQAAESYLPGSSTKADRLVISTNALPVLADGGVFAPGCDLSWSPDGQFLLIVQRETCTRYSDVNAIGFVDRADAYREIVISQKFVHLLGWIFLGDHE